MNLRDLGVKWRSDDLGITLWMHPGSHFNKWLIVGSVVDRMIPYDNTASDTGNHTINNLRTAFIFLEACVLDFECDDDCKAPVASYLKQRSPFNVTANLEVFLMTLEYADVDFVFDAYKDTRPVTGDTENEALDTEGKKKLSA